MATIDGLTKARMLAIEAESITAARIDPITNHLILTTHGGTDIDVGNVQGPQGNQGIQGPLPPVATTVDGPDAFGSASAVGTSTSYARADHKHGLPRLGFGARYSRVGAWNTGTSGIWLLFNFDQKNRDDDNLYNLSTGQFTITTAGKYLISAKVRVTTNAVNQILGVSVYKNGVLYAQGPYGYCPLGAGNFLDAFGSWVVPCSVNDIISIYQICNTTGVPGGVGTDTSFCSLDFLYP